MTVASGVTINRRGPLGLKDLGELTAMHVPGSAYCRNRSPSWGVASACRRAVVDVKLSCLCMQDLLAGTNQYDASGNPKLADIGLHIRRLLKSHFDRVDVKYIDPTYMVRAIATTSQDRIYCRILAHNAVHGAFAGFTGAPPPQWSGPSPHPPLRIWFLPRLPVQGSQAGYCRLWWCAVRCALCCDVRPRTPVSGCPAAGRSLPPCAVSEYMLGLQRPVF